MLDRREVWNRHDVGLIAEVRFPLVELRVHVKEYEVEAEGPRHVVVMQAISEEARAPHEVQPPEVLLLRVGATCYVSEGLRETAVLQKCSHLVFFPARDKIERNPQASGGSDERPRRRNRLELGDGRGIEPVVAIEDLAGHDLVLKEVPDLGLARHAVVGDEIPDESVCGRGIAHPEGGLEDVRGLDRVAVEQDAVTVDHQLTVLTDSAGGAGTVAGWARRMVGSFGNYHRNGIGEIATTRAITLPLALNLECWRLLERISVGA